MYRYFKKCRGTMLDSIARVKEENAEKYLNWVEITEAEWKHIMYDMEDLAINYIYD